MGHATLSKKLMRSSTTSIPYVPTRTPPVFSPNPARSDVLGRERRPESKNPLVLIVDDHDDSRAIERLVLESAGFRVLEARAGREGFQLACDHVPDAVLLDMVLPELDGWEIARLLRAKPETRGATIIAVTAVATYEDHDRALLSGCDEVLMKPVSPTALLRTVQRYVGFPAPPMRRDC